MMSNTQVLSFASTKSEDVLIRAIANRWMRMLGELAGADFYGVTIEDLIMDITACHCNGNALKLQELLDADDFNFAHDVFGINRHLARRTGAMLDCFLPRFAQCRDD
jgi:hypothetical protein